MSDNYRTRVGDKCEWITQSRMVSTLIQAAQRHVSLKTGIGLERAGLV